MKYEKTNRWELRQQYIHTSENEAKKLCGKECNQGNDGLVAILPYSIYSAQCSDTPYTHDTCNQKCIIHDVRVVYFLYYAFLM